MSGQASDWDEHTLKVGDRCIIEVDRVNSPEGLWWGVVTEVNGGLVSATIQGGRFELDSFDKKPVYSDEHQGREPNLNYTVFPDTRGIRSLFSRVLYMAKEVAYAARRMSDFRDDTAATLDKALQIAASTNVKIQEMPQG